MSKIRFDLINKYNIAIGSLKNKLKAASDINELTIVAGQIMELENKIILERTSGYQKLEKERIQVLAEIDNHKRALARLEGLLHTIEQRIKSKTTLNQKIIEAKLSQLHIEYNQALQNLDKQDDIDKPKWI